ncbi:ferrodoxin oxidoreductase beta subunit [Psychromonas sp. RZ22]|uniref:ferrodoxin oxidoreductase beta subunit n=1 Tax=Psychromonas algarum TaxID=2555643 RepID=UPI00106763C8|nr:ferrodoxin oxidoreductase beta subunit [Psychromonas sp. RZ22]TEW54674.1 ferrodoxin oxidoreductase beta subunit [Psychromonas sp. RZ22]
MKLILLTAFLVLSNIAYSATLTAGIKSVGIQLGSASIGNEKYTVVGASIGYFALENLMVGGAYEYWFSGTPTVSKATLQSTYYIPASEKIKPYFGLLYSHYFVEDVPDVDSYGYRVGVAYINSPMLVSAGIRQEKYTSNKSIFYNDDVTGEVVIGFNF